MLIDGTVMLTSPLRRLFNTFSTKSAVTERIFAAAIVPRTFGSRSVRPSVSTHTVGTTPSTSFRVTRLPLRWTVALGTT